MVKEAVEEALIPIEKMVGEVQTLKPWILWREAFRFAELLDEPMLGRPIQAIRGEARIPLEVVQSLLPVRHDLFPVGGLPGAKLAHDL